MGAYECSISEVSSIARSSTSPLRKTTKVCSMYQCPILLLNLTDPNSAGGRISPTLAQQTMSYAPPLLRLAASPHDTHLLATFSQDSKIIRILDVRQPGQ